MKLFLATVCLFFGVSAFAQQDSGLSPLSKVCTFSYYGTYTVTMNLVNDSGSVVANTNMASGLSLAQALDLVGSSACTSRTLHTRVCRMVYYGTYTVEMGLFNVGGSKVKDLTIGSGLDQTQAIELISSRACN